MKRLLLAILLSLSLSAHAGYIYKDEAGSIVLTDEPCKEANVLARWGQYEKDLKLMLLKPAKGPEVRGCYDATEEDAIYLIGPNLKPFPVPYKMFMETKGI